MRMGRRTGPRAAAATRNSQVKASIELDARAWQRPDDFYEALLPRLGAPDWHGRNLDALNDSIFNGQINRVEPPYHISVKGTASLSGDMRVFLRKVRRIFAGRGGEAGASISFEPPL
jgi:RNAse (barnase) inhibitor barstar